MTGSGDPCRRHLAGAVVLAAARTAIAVLDPGIGLFALFDAVSLFIMVVFYIAVRANIRCFARDALLARGADGWSARPITRARYASVRSIIWLFVFILSLVILASSVLLVPVAMVAVDQARCMFPVQLLPFETAVPLAVLHLVLAVPLVACLVLLGRAMRAELEAARSV